MTSTVYNFPAKVAQKNFALRAPSRTISLKNTFLNLILRHFVFLHRIAKLLQFQETCKNYSNILVFKIYGPRGLSLATIWPAGQKGC